MANTTLTTGLIMSLPIPSTQTGPQYAIDINNCLTTVSQHDHTTGKGVPITQSSINITGALSFNNNNITALKSTIFQSQSAALPNTILGAIYEVNGELYYNSGTDGFPIPITSGHSVTGASGTITGLPSGSAGAAYNAGLTKFVFSSATNTPANIDAGAILVREVLLNSNAVTIQSPSSLASSYALTLPTGLPSTTKIVTFDGSGNLAASYTVDNSTINIVSSVIGVKSAGITETQIASSALGTGLQGGSGTILTVHADEVSLTTSGSPSGTVHVKDSGITTVKIADSNVTEAKLSSSVAGNGLSGGAGTPLAVNVDNLSLQIVSDILSVKIGGIIGSMIASAPNGVTGAKINQNTVTGGPTGNIGIATITGGGGGNIAGNTIQGNNIATNVNLEGTATRSGGPDPRNLIVSNTNAATNLAVIRLAFASNAGYLVGEGSGVSGTANATHTGTGIYDITFTTAFNSTPIAVACPASINVAAAVTAISTTTMTVKTNTCTTGSAVDSGFTIIVMGPRT